MLNVETESFEEASGGEEKDENEDVFSANSSDDNDNNVCDEIEYANKQGDQVIEVDDDNSQEEGEYNSKYEENNSEGSSK